VAGTLAAAVPASSAVRVAARRGVDGSSVAEVRDRVSIWCVTARSVVGAWAVVSMWRASRPCVTPAHRSGRWRPAPAVRTGPTRTNVHKYFT